MMYDSEAKRRWQKENMMMICLKLHRKNDSDLIDFLEENPQDKQKTIKLALREYMKSHPNE